MSILDQLLKELRRVRFDAASEDVLQRQIWDVLLRLQGSTGIDVERERVLSPQDRIDFLVSYPAGEVGIEVKIKGSPTAVFTQMERYSKHGFDALILVTSRSQVTRYIEALPNVHVVKVCPF